MPINWGNSVLNDSKEDLTRHYDEAEKHLPKSKSVPAEFKHGVPPEQMGHFEKAAQSAVEAIPFIISPKQKAWREANPEEHQRREDKVQEGFAKRHREDIQMKKEDPGSVNRHAELTKKHGPSVWNNETSRHEYGSSGIAHVGMGHAENKLIHKERMSKGDEAAENLSISIGKKNAEKNKERYQNMKPERRDKIARVTAYNNNAPYSFIKSRRVELGRGED